MKRTLWIFAGILVVLAIVFFLSRGAKPKFSPKNPKVVASSSSPAKVTMGAKASDSHPEPVSQTARDAGQQAGMPPTMLQPELQPVANQKSATKAANVTGASRTAEINGDRVSAQVTVAGGSSRSFSPNELGLFPRVNIGLEETIPVAINYPEGSPGDLVTVQSEDGGFLEGKNTVMQARLDANRQLRFEFTSTQEGGIYRVTLRRGFDEKHLEFWGGPEPVPHKHTP